MKLVLVVDDDPVCRELVREALAGKDLQVLEASHGRQALELIEQTRPDLVLLDIQMPSSSGYKVLEHIRSDPMLSSLRVAALTAYAMRGDREKGLSAGFDAYITKPIEVSALRLAVNGLLNRLPT
jgi:CheY-like chemotaxis protein